MAGKAHNEADISDLDMLSRPSSSTPHHRPGHSGGHNLHESHPHSVSHHHEPSHGAHGAHSYGEDHFDDEHHHGSRRVQHGESYHHGGPHRGESYHRRGPHRGESYHRRGPHRGESYHRRGPHRGESYHRGRSHRGEPHHRGGPHHHGEPHLRWGPHHYGGSHLHANPLHHGESYHRGGPHHHSEAYHHGGPHHDVAHHHGGHSPHEAHHHRRPLHHGEAYSHHSYVEPYHDDIPGYISEHHRGHHDEHHHKEHHHGEHHHGEHHHGHHGEHQHREHHHGAHPHDYLQGDHHYGVHHHGGSEVFGPHKSYSMARASLDSTHSYVSARQPSIGHIQNLMRSRSMIHIPGAQVSSKVHPQDSSSKSSESWAEEDEQFQKRKAGRTQRPHKKLHTLYLCYWLWEKLSYFIQDLRRMLRNLIESLAFEAFIFLVVCLNTIMLVVQTFAEVEIRGDFFIMVMAVLDFMLMQLNYLSSRTFYHQSFRIFKVFKSLRALRAIRVLRRLSFLTSLQEVTGTLARSLPSITAILILMFTCLFLFSVVLRALFRQSDPKRFQNIFTTIFTLFTLLTLDDWSLIYLDSRAQGAWHIIPILMIYIIIQYFIFLNLVIAVLVDNFQMALLRGLEKVKQERAAWIHEKLLDDSLTELRKAEPVEEMSEHTKQKQLMEKKFGTMTEKQQEVLFHFLQLVAGVEHYQQKFRSQASVIDEIVDTTFEAGEEDFRK
ncbi:cation channel sperm-associated protein 1 isoform X3 [Equus caballus]|uniref:cation channel sperm-associated protein 1 isoform X3 n=1 Tax=Equus caballus TaxID=9796 RepID=UPI0038B31FDE